jgi:hypothetical protein
LTRSASIQLHERFSLQRHPRAITCAPDNFPNSPGPPWQSRQAIIFRLAALFSPPSHRVGCSAAARQNGHTLCISFRNQRRELQAVKRVATIAMVIGSVLALLWIAPS